MLLVQLRQGAESWSKSVELQQGDSWSKSGAVLLVESMCAMLMREYVLQGAEGLGCTMVEWVGPVVCHQVDCLEEWG